MAFDERLLEATVLQLEVEAANLTSQRPCPLERVPQLPTHQSTVALSASMPTKQQRAFARTGIILFWILGRRLDRRHAPYRGNGFP
ncbi:MAG: hypothetical protein OXJ54_17180 [Gemmatimonadetes bacterium]|nr:hypothetical protein [Candidatus Palauibacter rhopaloidicola]MDE2895974.1 hypothetical protein [Chloroflexota bacterium]